MTNLHSFLLAQCLLFLLSYSATAVANPAGLEKLSYQQTNKNSLLYNHLRHDFPNECLYRAYLVIQRFKRSITSDPKNITTTWTGHDICGEETYLGFYCAAPLGGANKELTVTAILFNGFGLHAPKLQGFIDQLPDLAIFHASSNNFGDEIPLLAGLPYLYKLHVDDDIQTQDYGDSVTKSRFNVGCLVGFLNFRFRVATGKDKGKGMPGWTNGKALLLNYNSLSGSLPSNLGSSKLSYLALANNKLTGPIPPSIAQSRDSLLEVLFLNNQLSGCLPHELGLLSRASVIDAGMNKLSGPIPASFACLSSVEQLNLAGNRLYGEVPDVLCQLGAQGGRLANLSLSGNYFTSVGPACSALIKHGVLDVKNNCIPGYANQRRPEECASFMRQPKTCPASTHVPCSAVAGVKNVAPDKMEERENSNYVTYATLHE